MTPSPQPPFGVLILPGGTEIGLEVRRSLAELKEVVLAGAGSPADRHGPFAYKRWATVPAVTEPGWQDELNAAIERFGIDFVFPGHDDALVAMVESAETIAARVVTSPVHTCRLTRSKGATYSALADVVPVPRVYPDAAAVDRYPVFVKPDAAQGSRGAMLIHDAEHLERAVAGGSDLIMEYLPGEELTVDCFSDRDQGLLFARARPRLRTRAGISMSSRTVHEDPVVRDLAAAIDARLDLHGAWFFQLREDATGRLRLLEVAPRPAGTSAVHRVTGVNFALLSIYEQLRLPVRISPNATSVELDRALVNRYRHDLRYGAVYVDLDDTLIVRNAVHTGLVAFLYQCLNSGHPLVLLTRHRGDLEQTLTRFRLHGLWDRVVHVAEHEAKADFIVERDAILIDDSFRERADAHEQRGIATFDASMIELLLDDRA
jgi:hypothetical protein